MSPSAVTCCLELTPIRRKPIMKGAVPYVRHPVKAVAVHNGPTGTWPLVPKGGRTEALQVSQADQAPVSLIPGRFLDQHAPTFPGPCQQLPTLTGLHEALWCETINVAKVTTHPLPPEKPRPLESNIKQDQPQSS